MTEFAINASVLEMTKFAPFESDGGYMPSMNQVQLCDTKGYQ